MHVPTRVTTTWVLAALFALATGVDQGWHFVPGNGHLVEVPGGYVGVGITLCRAYPSLSGGEPALDNPEREAFPRAHEGDCAICRLSGQGQSRAETVHFVPAIPFGQDLPATTFSGPCEPIRPPFQARAPPPA